MLRRYSPKRHCTRRFASRLAVLLLAVAGTGLCFQSALLAQSVAYMGATIETMGEAGTIENGIIVVDGDKIMAVGADIDIPSDARIVNVQGKTIMPGIIDPYFVFARDESSASFREVVFRGRTFRIPNTATFNPGQFTRIGDYFYPFKFNFMPALRSGVTTGNLVADGQGLSAYANITDDRTPEMLFQEKGYLFAKVTNQTNALDIIRKPLAEKPADKAKSADSKKSTDTKKADDESADKTDGKADETKSAAAEAKERWAAVRDGEQPVFVNVNNEASVAYVLQIFKEADKAKLVLVATGDNLYQSLDAIEDNDRVTVVLQPGIETVPFSTNLMNVSQLLAERKIPFAISMSLSGSQLSGSQDDPMFPLAMLVRTGLARKIALEAVTIKPAKLLGIEKTHGSLEKDKQANLLIFDGDPLATGNRLTQVILNGNIVHEN